MIRVRAVDDHLVLRAGLTAFRASAPEAVRLATASSERDLCPALRAPRPGSIDLAAGGNATAGVLDVFALPARSVRTDAELRMVPAGPVWVRRPGAAS